MKRTRFLTGKIGRGCPIIVLALLTLGVCACSGTTGSSTQQNRLHLTPQEVIGHRQADTYRQVHIEGGLISFLSERQNDATT